MGVKFNQYVSELPQLKKQFLSSPLYIIKNGLPENIPKSGIYLFSKGNRHLYVGRSDNIRRRMGMHIRPSAGQNQATFAFRIAKRQLRIGKPSYTTKGSRNDLVSGTDFNDAFLKAKENISRMNVRFMEIRNPVLQALFEIYLSVELGTPYNEFKTT